jgi:hypothetical protein
MRAHNRKAIRSIMRKELLLAALLTAVTVCTGQVIVRTRAFSFGKPGLGVKAEFLGENGATWLNANARGTITLIISNSGAATARGTMVTLSPGAQLKDIQIVPADSLGDVKPGEILTERIAVSAPGDAQSETGPIVITVKAGPGPVSAETKVEITVRGIPVPRLTMQITGGVGGVTAGEISKIRGLVQNTGTGEARGVTASFPAPAPGTESGIAETGRTIPLGTLAPGSSKEITLTLKPSRRVKGPAAFVVWLDEESSRFSVSETLSVQVKPAGEGAEEAGFAAFNKGDYNQAIASLEKVVAAGKATKEDYYRLGFSYFKTRNRARCLASMQKSSGLGSNEAKAWLNDNTTPVVGITVTYKQVEPDPFDPYNPPVGLGVLPFADSLGRDTPLTARLYNALKAKNESLRVFPFSTIKSEQTSWGLTALAPSNRQILSALEKDLSINFAIAGVARDTTGSAFSMEVIRCRDGEPVLTQEFRTSTNSTAIDDAVMLLLKRRAPVYTMSRTVEVKLP